jgi:hypothetical protein
MPDLKGFTTFETGGLKQSADKLDWTILPFSVLERTVEIMNYGAKKYTPLNWLKVPKEEYVKALLRHLIAYLTNEEIDPESNHHHIDHLICNAIFLSYHIHGGEFDSTFRKDPS